MKLRNKKTGKIAEAESCNSTEETIVLLLAMDGRERCEIYNSLAELNADWEDAKPAEPLIKDEKIRKAVRAWADASKIEKVFNYGDYFWIGLRSTDKESVWKFECNYMDASDLQNKDYTIAELCGEGEE